MIKSLNRKVRYAAFDAKTQLILARYRVRLFVLDVKHSGLRVALANIARGGG